MKALDHFNKFVDDPEGYKSTIKDVFTTVMRTAIVYDESDNANWNKMWDLLQVHTNYTYHP